MSSCVTMLPSRSILFQLLSALLLALGIVNPPLPLASLSLASTVWVQAVSFSPSPPPLCQAAQNGFAPKIARALHPKTNGQSQGAFVGPSPEYSHRLSIRG